MLIRVNISSQTTASPDKIIEAPVREMKAGLVLVGQDGS